MKHKQNRIGPDGMFIPSEKQILLVQEMIDGKGKATISAFCKNIDITRKTYYNWFDDTDFCIWFNKEWEMAMAKKVTWLDRVGLNNAPKDFRYWEALQMKYGKFRRGGDVTSGGDPVSININYGDKPTDES